VKVIGECYLALNDYLKSDLLSIVSQEIDICRINSKLVIVLIDYQQGSGNFVID